MSTKQFHISWDSYKRNVCNGFTNLQQNEEFVDMTLAADGHFVKVHKSIFALASPYMKSILQSTVTTHPIIFLSNTSHEILNYILTYVYTGEVSVGVDKIQSFMTLAKDLQITGLFDMPTPNVGSKKLVKSDLNQQRHDNAVPVNETPVDGSVTDYVVVFDSVNATETALTNIELLDKRETPKQIIGTHMDNVSNVHTANDNITQKDSDLIDKEGIPNNRDSGLLMTADGYQYKLEIQQAFKTRADPVEAGDIDNTSELMQAANSTINVSSVNENNGNLRSFEDDIKNQFSTALLHPDSLTPKAITLQYTTSNRGCLQLILNRYMYYCHHQSHGGRKRRWRCIEYRSKSCPAFIDTDGEIMTSRKFGHCHSFHDEKIRKKMKKDLIFTNLNVLLEKQNEKKKIETRDQ